MFELKVADKTDPAVAKAKLLIEATFFIIIFTYLIYRSKMAKEYFAA